MAAALSVAVFGPLVKAMGAGRDGGRDMYYDGPLTWSGGVATPEQWNGYTVFQVKHKDGLDSRPTTNAAWLWTEVKKELDLWADASGTAKSPVRKPLPDQLVFITNVPLTPAPAAGGHDALRSNLAKYRSELEDGSRDADDAATVRRVRRRDRIRQIQRVEFWDANQVKALLTVHEGVRRRFDAFLTVSDVFSQIAQFTDVVSTDRASEVLLDHARTELASDGLVYFDQAGSRDNRGIPVHDVAIDLPLVFPAGGRRTTVLSHVLRRGDLVLAKDITSRPGPRHIIITGQPGNGKSTVSQLVVQAFRAAALDGSANLSASHEATIAGTKGVLTRLGHSMPKSRRWPIKVNLAKFAEERGHVEDETLLRYLADKISKRSQVGRVTPAVLNTWMRNWPWIVVLDGLDEVTEPTVRRRLIERVVEFVNNAEGDNADLLVVLTTRPNGYTEAIAPTLFETVALDDLTPFEAVSFGLSATRIRIGDHADRLERVEAGLDAAARDDNMSRLLRTPLQALILSIIIDGAGQVEPDRYSLFWNYYDTVFRRERDKSDGIRNLLNTYGPLIQQLHELAGFRLQQVSELGDHSNATLALSDVERIAWEVLDAAGYKPDGEDRDVIEMIVSAAMDRLVLLAPKSEGFGFDVRSLQELMAALFIMNAPPERALSRLRITAPGPHWRNTWLFAAGKVFSTPEPHAHQQLVDLVEDIDQHAAERLGQIVPIGPGLALDILDDGMARSWPDLRHRLLTQGMRVFDEPDPTDIYALIRVILRYADTGTAERNDVASALRKALSGPPITRRNVATVLELIPAIAPEIGVGPEAIGLTHVRADPALPLPDGPVADWASFDEELYTAPGSAEQRAVLLDAGIETRSIHPVLRGEGPQDLPAFLAAIAEPAAAAVLESALLHLCPADREITVLLRDAVLPDVHRRRVGSELDTAISRASGA